MIWWHCSALNSSLPQWPLCDSFQETLAGITGIGKKVLHINIVVCKQGFVVQGHKERVGESESERRRRDASI